MGEQGQENKDLQNHWQRQEKVEKKQIEVSDRTRVEPGRFLMRKTIVCLGLVASVAMVMAGPAWASRKQLAKRIEQATEYFQDLMEAPDYSIPQTLLQTCRGVIIIRQYKAGFVVGVKGGAGVVLVRDEKSKVWSPPAFVASGEGSFGFQIGGQAIDAVLLIMNREGMEMLARSKFKIGVDASAAVGPVGRDAAAKISPGTAILVYSRTRGLYAGAAFEGGVLVSDDKANEEFYGKKGITLRDILFRGAVKMPGEALPLVELLQKYASP